MPGSPSSSRSRSTAGVITPRSSAISGSVAELAPRPRRRARGPGPRRQLPVERRLGAARGTAQYATKPRKWSMRADVDELERAAEALDPPAVAGRAAARASRRAGCPRAGRSSLQSSGGTPATASVEEELRVGAVVGARRARRRSGRRRSAATLALARRTRAAPTTRARSAPGRRARPRPRTPPSRPSRTGGARRSSSISASRSPSRVRVGEQAGPAREGRRGAVRRAVLVRRAERQDLPPRLAGRREPVDEAVRLVAEPAARQRGRVQQDAARAIVERHGRLLSATRTGRETAGDDDAHEAHSKNAAAAHPDHERQADRRLRPPPGQALGRRPGRRQATIFRDGHEILGAQVLYRGPGRRSAGESAPLELALATTSSRGSFEVDASRPLAVPRRGLDRPRRDLARRAPPQGRGRRGGSRERARRGRGAPRRSPSLDVETGARLDGVRPARHRRARRRSRSTSTARSVASAPGTSSSRAPSAASTASRRCCPSSPSSASTSSTSRRSTRSAAPGARAATTRCRAQPRRPGQPVGDRRARRAGTTRSIPSSARSPTSTGSSRSAKELGLEIALDFAIQCSPDHPWLKEHPEWFQHRPDGTIKYAENPPEEVPGHRQRRLGVRGLARALGGAARRRPATG